MVDIELLGNCHLGAHTIGGGRQVGLAVILERRQVKEASKATHAANHTGPVSCLDGVLHQLNSGVARLNIYTSRSVGNCVLVLAHLAGLSVSAGRIGRNRILGKD